MRNDRLFTNSLIACVVGQRSSTPVGHRHTHAHTQRERQPMWNQNKVAAVKAHKFDPPVRPGMRALNLSALYLPHPYIAM